jgi:hypothetical protein
MNEILCCLSLSAICKNLRLPAPVPAPSIATLRDLTGWEDLDATLSFLPTLQSVFISVDTPSPKITSAELHFITQIHIVVFCLLCFHDLAA